MKLFELRVWTKTDTSALAKHLSNKDLGQLPDPLPYPYAEKNIE